MKLLIINCSPVRNGATAEVCNIVAKSCDGYTVKSVCIDDYHIALCRGCRSCHATAACPIKDDTLKLMAEFE